MTEEETKNLNPIMGRPKKEKNFVPLNVQAIHENPTAKYENFND